MHTGHHDEAGSAAPLTALDLVGVVYSAGKVFDGLSTGRLATEAFVRAGDTTGIASRPDLELLQDLKAVAERVVERAGTVVDAAYVRELNGLISRSGPLRPGELRRADQHIGVETPLGRHEPPALSDQDLAELIEAATSDEDHVENALELFVSIAKAQPFEDGNKRTALFAANALLLGAGSGRVLTVPMDEHDPSVAATFVMLLAQAYINNDHDGVKEMLRTHGLAELTLGGERSRTAEYEATARAVVEPEPGQLGNPLSAQVESGLPAPRSSGMGY